MSAKNQFTTNVEDINKGKVALDLLAELQSESSIKSLYKSASSFLGPVLDVVDITANMIDPNGTPLKSTFQVGCAAIGSVVNPVVGVAAGYIAGKTYDHVEAGVNYFNPFFKPAETGIGNYLNDPANFDNISGYMGKGSKRGQVLL